MIELIVLLATSYIVLFALLTLLVLMGSVLLRRARTDVADDAAPEGADRDGGDEDATVGV
jgi:hypothetical protein